MRAIILLLFLNLCASCFAQELTANSSSDKDEYALGERIDVTLKLEYPKGFNGRFSKITLPAGIELLDSSSKMFTHPAKNGIIKKLGVIAFDSGTFTFPAASALIISADRKPFEVSTNELTIKVHRITVDTTKPIKPIVGPLSVSYSAIEILEVVLPVILLLICVYFLWRYLRQRKKHPKTIYVPEEKKIAPEGLFMQHLAEVKQMIDSGEKQKFYYSLLSHALREYLEGAYSINALERTTAEIVEDLHDMPFDKVVLIERILRLSDMVKFAKFKATNEETTQILNDSEKLVQAELK